MKTSFFPRFLTFTLSFWCGVVISVFLLTAINAASFFHGHFWLWFANGIRYNLLPVAMAEIFRSPLMGLLFALLGSRDLGRPDTIRLGSVFGAASYAIANVFTLAGFASWSLAPYFRQPMAEYIILGLPIALILLSRFSSRSQAILVNEGEINKIHPVL